MKNQTTRIDRRTFFKGSGQVIVGLSASSLIPQLAWAKTDEVETLAQLIFEMFPHPQVPMKYYKQTAQSLFDQAKGKSELQKTLGQGIQTAHSFYGKPFNTLTSRKKELVMDRLRPTDFYSTVRGHTVGYFYNIQGVWSYFGYEGSSFEKGGYIDRGLDDIFWLN